jgi:hypothetical protein
MTILASLRTTGRAAVVAFALAGTALAAMPVQAAPLLKDFSLQVQPKGDQKGMQLKKFKGTNDFFFWCLTDKQIRQGLKAYGFFDVDIVAHLGKNRVRVEAGWDDWYYSFRVNRCSGEVDKIKKLHPAWDDDDDFPF